MADLEKIAQSEDRGGGKSTTIKVVDVRTGTTIEAKPGLSDISVYREGTNVVVKQGNSLGSLTTYYLPREYARIEVNKT